VFVFLFVIVRYLADLKILWRAPYRPRVSPRNRANPRPSYAKNEPRWGEKEFGRNNVLKPFFRVLTENLHIKTKSNSDPQMPDRWQAFTSHDGRLDLVYHQDPGIHEGQEFPLWTIQ